MMVVVLSSTGVRLMPTSCYKARKLLRKGKAVIFQHEPFTIRLTQREDGDTQPIEYCCDTGYLHIGVSVKSAKHEFFGVQTDMLSDEKEHHTKALMYRRTRRNRKRYRKTRFNNRKRDKGWLAPSIEHKVDIHEDWFDRMCEVVPITDGTFEMGNFDTQKLKAIEEGKPVPVGTDYQHGEQYGFDDLRNAVFSRDNHTCVVCNRGIKDGAILHAHHCDYRSKTGTNRMANLVTVCEKCHTPANHKPGGILWKMQDEYKPKSFKGATYMTAVRWQLYNRIKAKHPDVNIHITYGSTTKKSRRDLHMPKTHINDAYVMGQIQPKHRTQHHLYTKKRRNNRVLAKFYDAKYKDPRDGKEKTGQQLFNGRTNRNHNTDTENLHKYRSKKVRKGRTSIRKKHYQIQPGDIVLYEGKRYVIKGCQHYGQYVQLADGKSVSVKKVKILHYAGGYVRSTLERNAGKKGII